YSMGGYGLIVNLGGGYSDYLVTHETAPNHDLAIRHAGSNPNYRQHLDPRIKAGFAVAPWGMADRIWEKNDLHSIDIPMFFLAGSLDETAGYELGTRALFENVRQSDRYLLTFINAGHNAIAPIPLPIEFLHSADQTGASHYTDAVWDSTRSSNVMMHFATAFFDLHLKGRKDRLAYLELLPDSQDGVFSIAEDQPTDAHTYWKGFPQYSARGLLLEHLEPEE
ncbi:MAG: dienelactone hydrolase, partial [Proteobacteria bacterium]|nr:dienelactone hydrolase [Pseudomonadota bacterium]